MGIIIGYFVTVLVVCVVLMPILMLHGWLCSLWSEHKIKESQRRNAWNQLHHERERGAMTSTF